MDDKHDPEKGDGCERTEATVPLWLILRDGVWKVYGIGSDELGAYCGNDHVLELTDDEYAALRAFIERTELELGAEVPA